MAAGSSVKRRVPTAARPRGWDESDGAPLDSVFLHLPAEGVPVDAQRVGGLGEAPVRAAQDSSDEPLFEFADRVVEVDASVDHFFYELVESIGNHGSSSPPVSRRKASTYFSRVFQ